MPTAQNTVYGKIIVIKRSGQDSASFELTDASYLFGRAEQCDIRIQLASIAEEHCRIFSATAADGNADNEFLCHRAAVQNLSSQGIMINGELVKDHKEHLLYHQDIVTIVERSFRYENPSVPRLPLIKEEVGEEGVKTPQKNSAGSPMKLSTPIKTASPKPATPQKLQSPMKTLTPQKPQSPVKMATPNRTATPQKAVGSPMKVTEIRGSPMKMDSPSKKTPLGTPVKPIANPDYQSPAKTFSVAVQKPQETLNHEPIDFEVAPIAAEYQSPRSPATFKVHEDNQATPNKPPRLSNTATPLATSSLSRPTTPASQTRDLGIIRPPGSSSMATINDVTTSNTPSNNNQQTPTAPSASKVMKTPTDPVSHKSQVGSAGYEALSQLGSAKAAPHSPTPATTLVSMPMEVDSLTTPLKALTVLQVDGEISASPKLSPQIKMMNESTAMAVDSPVKVGTRGMDLMDLINHDENEDDNHQIDTTTTTDPVSMDIDTTLVASLTTPEEEVSSVEVIMPAAEEQSEQVTTPPTVEEIAEQVLESYETVVEEVVIEEQVITLAENEVAAVETCIVEIAAEQAEVSIESTPQEINVECAPIVEQPESTEQIVQVEVPSETMEIVEILPQEEVQGRQEEEVQAIQEEEVQEMHEKVPILPKEEAQESPVTISEIVEQREQHEMIEESPNQKVPVQEVQPSEMVSGESEYILEAPIVEEHQKQLFEQTAEQTPLSSIEDNGHVEDVEEVIENSKAPVQETAESEMQPETTTIVEEQQMEVSVESTHNEESAPQEEHPMEQEAVVVEEPQEANVEASSEVAVGEAPSTPRRSARIRAVSTPSQLSVAVAKPSTAKKTVLSKMATTPAAPAPSKTPQPEKTVVSAVKRSTRKTPAPAAIEVKPSTATKTRASTTKKTPAAKSATKATSTVKKSTKKSAKTDDESSMAEEDSPSINATRRATRLASTTATAMTPIAAIKELSAIPEEEDKENVKSNIKTSTPATAKKRAASTAMEAASDPEVTVRKSARTRAL